MLPLNKSFYDYTDDELIQYVSRLDIVSQKYEELYNTIKDEVKGDNQ